MCLTILGTSTSFSFNDLFSRFLSMVDVIDFDVSYWFYSILQDKRQMKMFAGNTH